MGKQEAFITPSILEWAINRAGVSVEHVHEKAAKWISGEARPTFKQAMDIAKKLQIPFGYLWLKVPPLEKEIIPDLRTIGNRTSTEMPLELKTTLNDIKQKQEWFKEYAKANDLLKCEIAGNFTIHDDTQKIADDIAAKLKISNIVGEKYNKDQMLKSIIEKIESLGILVMRNSIFRGNTRKKLDLNIFRGFAIFDDVVPLIFVNTNDSKAGQIFTLMHELAHLWIGESGISDLDIQNSNDIEIFCNEIAAKVLMPDIKIRQTFKTFADENWLENMANQFSVSTLAILNRLKSLNLISMPEYRELYSDEQEKFNCIPKQKQKGAPSPEVMIKTKNGNLFTFAVTSAVLSGDETYTNGANLLGFKHTDLISKIAKEIGL